MTLNLQEQVDILETRTDSLESVLGQFISSMNKMMLRQEAAAQKFTDEMKEFKDEMKEFKGEMSLFRDGMNSTVTRMEADTKALKDEMKDFKGEMKDFKDEMRDFKNESRAEHRKLREDMGKLDRKMGTLVEDMVAPNIRGIAKDYFNDSRFVFFAVRVWKERAGSPGEGREFDVIAVSEKYFYVNETKSKPKPEHAGDFLKVLDRLHEYFPESRDRKIVPIYASLFIPENIQKHLAGYGIYAMGMREGTMELLNFTQVSELRAKTC